LLVSPAIVDVVGLSDNKSGLPKHVKIIPPPKYKGRSFVRPAIIPSLCRVFGEVGLRVGAQLRESREVAQQWIGALGSVPQDDVGLLVVEIIRSLSFDITMMVRKGKIDADKVPEIVKTLNTMALTQMRIEKATSDNVKRAREIRKLAIEEVSEVIEKTAVQQGMNAEQAAFWRNKVLGVQ